MKLLITGAKGFVGKNLIAEINNINEGNTKRYPHFSNIIVYECDIDTSINDLDEFCKDCDYVIHLAGVNRPQNAEEFMEGNYGFTTQLLVNLSKHNNKAPILMSSSIQAELANDYGMSKKAGEDYLLNYCKDNEVRAYIFRLPNVFGKWCRPNYNSAIATFCHNIARGLPITVSNRDYIMTLVYIDDVIHSFLNTICGEVVVLDGYCKVPIEHNATLGAIVDNLYSFQTSRINLKIPDMGDEFIKKLYATYLSYLPADQLSYPLESHTDDRGSFTEFLHTINNGQVSINVSKPNITKGEHWHHTKNEKFLVVSGEGIIRLRSINEDDSKIVEYYVSGKRLEVIDIPVGFTHNIENIGNNDMVTIMWCSEIFDEKNPDTYSLKVKQKSRR